MVIVIIFLSLLVFGAQVVLCQFVFRTFIVQFGTNTAAKVPFFYVLYKYFVLKLHNLGMFVRKKLFLCKFFFEV